MQNKPFRPGCLQRLSGGPYLPQQACEQRRALGEVDGGGSGYVLRLNRNWNETKHFG